MATAGELVEFLSCFDQHLSVQILAVSGSDSSEVVSVAAMNAIYPTVAWAAEGPSAIWLVAQHRAASDPDSFAGRHRVDAATMRLPGAGAGGAGPADSNVGDRV